MTRLVSVFRKFPQDIDLAVIPLVRIHLYDREPPAGKGRLESVHCLGLDETEGQPSLDVELMDIFGVGAHEGFNV